MDNLLVIFYQEERKKGGNLFLLFWWVSLYIRDRCKETVMAWPALLVLILVSGVHGCSVSCLVTVVGCCMLFSSCCSFPCFLGFGPAAYRAVKNGLAHWPIFLGRAGSKKTSPKMHSGFFYPSPFGPHKSWVGLAHRPLGPLAHISFNFC